MERRQSVRPLKRWERALIASIVYGELFGTEITWPDDFDSDLWHRYNDTAQMIVELSNET